MIQPPAAPKLFLIPAKHEYETITHKEPCNVVDCDDNAKLAKPDSSMITAVLFVQTHALFDL